MSSLIRVSFAALALAIGPILASCVVAPYGGVAFGYRDGYWDRDHYWHAWASPDEAYRFRSSYADHYYDRPHDGERNGGWRDDDRYWEHH